jgi:hypothetical protein
MYSPIYNTFYVRTWDIPAGMVTIFGPDGTEFDFREGRLVIRGAFKF